MNDLIPKYPYISEIKCTWSCPLLSAVGLGFLALQMFAFMCIMLVCSFLNFHTFAAF